MCGTVSATFTNYVPAYSKVAKLLTQLLGNIPFKWGPMEQHMFDGLKSLIASQQVVVQPLPEGQFRVEVNASGQGLGGVLSQKHPDVKWQTIAFISCIMAPAELNYDIYDKELLTIMFALDEW